MRKLACMEAAVRENAPLSCVLETTLPHLKCICALAESFPETPMFSEKFIRYSEKDRQYTCAGLGDALNTCWREGKLPWEMRIAWAQKPHDLSFP